MEVLILKTWAQDMWMVYIDGDCNSRGSRVGIVLFTPIGRLIEQCLYIIFQATNNAVECELWLLELRQLWLLEVKKVFVHSVSCLIIN